MDKLYRYFIAYSYSSKYGSGFGNLERRTNKKITGIQQLKDLSEEICRDFNFETAVISNFILFEDD